MVVKTPPTLAFLVLLALCATSQAGTVFVKAGGTGNGSSWSAAMGDLQAAIESCARNGGGEIWVAAGIYKPSSRPNGGDLADARTVHFSLRNGVTVRCGFPGDAAVGGEDCDEAGDADPEANPTVLSGDVGTEDTDADGDGVPDEAGGDSGDNAYHVFLHPASAALDNTAALSGAWIVGGRTANVGHGGGMLNESCSPALSDCVFRANLAYCGGGMHNGTSASPTISGTGFEGNTATGFGGGMFNWESSSPTVTDCVFRANSGPEGGGMANHTSCSPTITDCVFEANSSITGRGGGIYDLFESSPTVSGCQFRLNAALHGGAMCNVSSSPAIDGCRFRENSATSYGGGMFNITSSPVVDHCEFEANSASIGGGMVNVASASPMLADCLFMANAATTDGGAMANASESQPTITRCEFRSNTAVYGGGVINSSSSPIMTGCVLRENLASEFGGGMLSYSSSAPTVTSCVFVANAANGGGGVHNDSSSATLVNSVFQGNQATEDGGGMLNSSSSPTITNCVFHANRASQGGGMANGNASQPAVTNCVLWDNGTAIVGGNLALFTCNLLDDPNLAGWPGSNRNLDPLFADAADPDGPDDIWGTTDDGLRFLPGSPGIDAGDSEAVPEGVALDLAGSVRIFGEAVEIGAYEFTDVPSSVPAGESPSDGSMDALWTCTLDWGDCLHTSSYDVHVWEASGTRPEEPTASGLLVSEWAPRPLGLVLAPDTTYCWQVMAVYRYGETAGPVWQFRTKANETATFELSGSRDPANGAFLVTASDWQDPEGVAASYRYEWRHNGVPVEGLDGPDASLADVVGERGEAGLVSCRVTAWDGWDEGQSTEYGWAFYELEAGWNIVALPLSVDDARPEVLFTAADERTPLYSGTVWSWNGDTLRYERAETLEPGRGYWLYVPATERETGSVVVEGIVPEATDFPLGLHWRLVGFPPFLGGSSAADVRAATGAEGMQEWRDGGYALPTGMLEFLRGYWLYLREAKVLTPVAR